MKQLLIIEHDDAHKLTKATRSMVMASKSLAGSFDALVFGFNCSDAAADAARLPGCEQVLHVDDESFRAKLAENSAKLITELAQDYDAVLMPSTTWGKNILPRVAACLDVPMISDVVEIQEHDTFVRPIYAGHVLVKMQVRSPKKVLTIRSTAFAACDLQDTSAKIVPLSKSMPNAQSTLVGFEGGVKERPELTAARVVVSGGRGLKSAENFHWVEKLADKLGGAVGATRAVVDAGFVPNDYQVGQTGKVVAPDLYIAIGISGAVQHLAGMKDSRVIVAVNQDPDAPIFKIADYGLVGDLFEIVPKLLEVLEEEL